MAKDLLFEIGIEEIPARFMEPALKQIAEFTTAKLEAASLEFTALKTYGTPRRLTLIIEGLAEVQPDIVVESKGPAIKGAYDAAGEPTRALLGFCKGQGVEPASLSQKEIKGVPYVFATKEVKGQTTQELLPKILKEVVSKIYFPKPMRWGYGEMRFARPIRWLILLFGAEVLPLEIAGVTAGNLSRGHRFLGSQAVQIENAAAYEARLAKEFVIVDQAKRKELIWQQVQDVSAKAGGMVKDDQELLDEVVHILEYPTALLGSFEAEYLTMPAELIITPMREHQRYFPVYAKDGKLLNNFIAVRNGNSEHLAIVRAGNEKVLKARLADAAFFWNEDCKKPLEENLPRLETIVFHEKLGTLSSKVERVAAIANYIGEKLAYNQEQLADTARAAKLMKCDLVSNAVCEFTELQGIMGKYYAEKHGEAAQVAAAIEEHYLPRFAGDVLPQTKAGIALAIADRLDSLVGFFGQNMLPTGSQDPYALRRQAMGICQIIIRNDLKLPLADLLNYAYKLYANIKMVANEEDTKSSLIAFFKQRLENVLTDAGVSYDVINAALALPVAELTETYAKAVALQEFKQTAGFGELMAGYNRAANLLKKAANVGEPVVDLFQEAAEKALYEAVTATEIVVNQQIAAKNYAEALHEISQLRPLIDDFFSAVMVMADDEKIKNNRLALLKSLVNITNQIGDLTKLVA